MAKMNGKAAKHEKPAQPPAKVLALTEDEYRVFMNISSSRERLSSEWHKLDLLQENTFLKASMRLGMDLTNYGADLQNKLYVEGKEGEKVEAPKEAAPEKTAP